MTFSFDERATLKAAFDTVVPVDDWPGGWSGGGEVLITEQADGILAGCVPLLRRAVQQLDAAARSAGAASYAHLSSADRTAVLTELLAQPAAPTADGLPAERAVDRLVRVAFEGFYGGTSEPAGWAMLGYQPVPPGAIPVEPPLQKGIRPETMAGHYDVIIVGAGAGGGVAAQELTAHGLHVLLAERSRPMTSGELRGDHLRGKRAQLYDPIAGPGRGNPRIFENPDGVTRTADGTGDGAEYALNAMTLGGGTRLWQGMSWRFLAEDFAMASTYGVPAESSLVDWPFGYEELAPYYDRVEWELGVSGSGSSPITRRTPRLRDYPMPPLADTTTRSAFTAAARRLGFDASPIPFAINSRPRAGRQACVHCAQCIGHACPVDAKNGTQNTFIPRALSSGRCDLLMSAQVVRITHNGRGSATGVVLVVETAGGPVERRIAADQVVVAAGAVESPRLLLASGLGNEWTGRNSHSHGFVLALAGSGPAIKDFRGPGHTTATFDFVHTDPTAWGGGVIFDANPFYPVLQAGFASMFSGAPFGAKHKQWMRDHPVLLGTMSMVQEIPHEFSRVRLDPTVVDRYGMPAARIRGRAHPASVRACEYVKVHCEAWLDEVGGRDIKSIVAPGGSPGGEHGAGSVRMGHDPAMSACDAAGRLHGTTNVYVADASLHPTNGSVNPALTIMANAMRTAELVAAARGAS